MSNDKFSDDDFIGQLYGESKVQQGPPKALDDAILSMANQQVPIVGDAALDEPQQEPQQDKQKDNIVPIKKRWAIPRSLVACLVLSFMVGLIFRENADQLMISDPTELDYAMPHSAIMSSSADADVSSVAAPISAQIKKSATATTMRLKESAPQRAMSGLRREAVVPGKVPGKVLEKVSEKVMIRSLKSSAATSPEPIKLMKQAKKKQASPARLSEGRITQIREFSSSSQPATISAEQESTAQPIELSDDMVLVIPDEVKKRIVEIRVARDHGDYDEALVLLRQFKLDYPTMPLPDDVAIMEIR